MVTFMDQCGICSNSECFGEAVGPSWNVKIMYFGLLGCCSGWVFHSDSVLKSDGYLWWWWWWWWTTKISFVVSYIYFILWYLDSLFFDLSIEYNITEISLSIFSRFFGTFIIYIFDLVSLYFSFFKFLSYWFIAHLFKYLFDDRFP